MQNKYGETFEFEGLLWNISTAKSKTMRSFYLGFGTPNRPYILLLIKFSPIRSSHSSELTRQFIISTNLIK